MTTTNDSRRVERIGKKIDDLENLGHAEKKELFRLIVDHIDDARHNDAEFSDHFFFKLKARIEDEATFRPQVEAYVESKLRYLLGFVGLAGLVVSFFGVFGIDKFAGSRAQEVAQKIADNLAFESMKNFASLRTEVRQEVSQASANVDRDLTAALTRMNQDIAALSATTREQIDVAVATKGEVLAERYGLQAAKFQEDAKRARDEIDRDLQSARAESTTQFIRFQSRIDNEVEQAKREIETFLANAKLRADDREKAISDRMAELERQSDGAIARLKAILDNYEKQLKETGSTERSKMKQAEDTFRSGGSVTETDRATVDRSTLMIDLLELIFRRDFSFQRMYNLAVQAAKERNFPSARTALAAVLNRPSAYRAEDRMATVRLLVSDDVDAETRLHNATECIMAATRTTPDPDVEMAKFARKSRENNFLVQAQEKTGFVEVAEAVIDAKSADEIAKLIENVNRESLAPRGYLNLLAIAKRTKAIRMKLVEETQDELLRQIVTSDFIDRPSDYTTAYFLVETLGAEPFLDNPAIGDVLDLVERTVFKDKNTEDPWRLKDLIAKVREKLKPPPATPSQMPPGGQSAPPPSESEKPAESQPGGPNP